jgi:hypothetical protein
MGIGIGIAPGHANFVSVFGRSTSRIDSCRKVGGLVALSFPLLLCAWLEWSADRGPEPETALIARRFAFGWLAASLAGLLLFGTYFTHYFLPVLVPPCLICSRLLGDRESSLSATVARRRRGLSFAAIVGVGGGIALVRTVPKRLIARGTPESIRAVAAAIDRNRSGRMLV